MRVDTSDPAVTVVEDRPIFVPAFCLMFVLAGLYILIASTISWSWNANDAFGTFVALVLGGAGFLCTARRDSYRFDSAADRLDWIRRSLLGQRAGSLPLASIERVAVHGGPDSEDTTYRVVLYTTEGELFPLSHGFSAGERHHEDVAAAIEDALTRTPKDAIRSRDGG